MVLNFYGVIEFYLCMLVLHFTNLSDPIHLYWWVEWVESRIDLTQIGVNGLTTCASLTHLDEQDSNDEVI